MKAGVFGVRVPEDPARYQLRLVNDRGQTVEHPVSPLFGSYRTYYDNVGAALAHGEELLVKPEECLEAIRVIDAIQAFGRTRRGRQVDVEKDIFMVWGHCIICHFYGVLSRAMCFFWPG